MDNMLKMANIAEFNKVNKDRNSRSISQLP